MAEIGRPTMPYGRDLEAYLAISDDRDREAYPGIWQRSGGLPCHMAEFWRPTLP